MEVLLVDDDADIREAIGTLLEECGYDVSEAGDGNEALNQLRTSLRPCVVVLDLMMPRMDGWQFRAEQLRDPNIANVPVIVMTGAGNEAFHGAQLGVDDVIRKPPDLDRLLTAVARRCGNCDSPPS